MIADCRCSLQIYLGGRQIGPIGSVGETTIGDSRTKEFPVSVRQRVRRVISLVRQFACWGLLSWLLISTRAYAGIISQEKVSGPVTVTTTLEPDQPVIGDEVTLRIEVQAEADVEVLMPEFDEVISGFRIAEWIPKENIAADGSQVLSQTYRFQTSVSGKQVVPPMLVEFVDRRPDKPNAPEGYDAYEILTDPIEFQVQSVVPNVASAELKPPLGELQLPRERGDSSWLLPIASVVLAAAAVTLWLVRRGKTREARKLNAYEVAQARLQRLVDDRNSNSPSLTIEQFFVEISATVRSYLEDRFEIRAPELTTDEFLQVAAAESKLTPNHQRLLGEFLKQADLVKFAAVGASDTEVNRSIELARNFLEDTRQVEEKNHGSFPADGKNREDNSLQPENSDSQEVSTSA